MNILRLLNTIKYLKLKQVYYQLFYRIRNKFFKKKYSKTLLKEIKHLKLEDSFCQPNTYGDNNTFLFLNKSHPFEDQINWNFSDYGKLWTYNLNYFDFLNQENITKEKGVNLIKDYLIKDKVLKDGKEPYPISLRGINWIKFLSKHKVSEKAIDQTLYNHYQILKHNLEYHLLGNHLLENGYSLLFGAYYFQDESIYKKAKIILINQLKEQVLEDGAHFELSPMYHQIILYRLLDCINLIRNNLWKKDDLLVFFEEKAIVMLSWLREITYNNGAIPMVNDSTYDIAPNSEELLKYAKNIGLTPKRIILKDSGYRMLKNEKYELFLDVGKVGPKYQPGHAHSDIFNFELYVSNEPFIVDRGISTYEKDERRNSERSTKSHNTVMVNDYEQTEIWGGFRVGRRAEIRTLSEKQDEISALCSGFKNNSIKFQRKWKYLKSRIIIEDVILGRNKRVNKAFLHFHPTIKSFVLSHNSIRFDDMNIKINFDENCKSLESYEYDYCYGFNKTAKAMKLCIEFEKELKTEILFN